MTDSGQRRPRPSFEEAWRQRFIRFSANEDDAGIAGWSASGLEARFRHFVRVWPGDAAGAVWLDAGCGAGTYSRFLAGRGVQVIGMDYSHPTVLKARSRGRVIGLWAVADVTRLPVSDEALDGALCFGVIQALEHSEPALDDLVRAVRPGGQIWVDALNGWCLPALWKRLRCRLNGKSYHLRYELPGRMRRVMEAAGCRNVEIYWVPILPRSLQRFQSLVESAPARWLLRFVPIVAVPLSHAFVAHGIRRDV